jgi:hypothetical protein
LYEQKEKNPPKNIYKKKTFFGINDKNKKAYILPVRIKHKINIKVNVNRLAILQGGA